MDTTQLKAAFARIKELDTARGNGGDVEQELGMLGISVIEDFLLDHKRQTELLESIMFDLDARTNRELGRS